MQVSRTLWVVAVLAAFCGCREDNGQKPELYAPVDSAKEQKLEVTPRPEGTAPRPEPSAAAADSTQAASSELTVGMSREALMDTLGDCARRIAFEPGDGKGSLSVEVFQPKPGACVEKFEARRFTVLGGSVSAIDPGLDAAVDAPPPPERPARAARGEGL